MRPTAEVIKSMALMQRQYPEVASYISAWLEKELSQLPYASANPTLSQGRCQVLMELNKLIIEAPEMAANPKGKPTSTHTG
jgi:flagellar motor switch protein FliG